MKVKNHCVVCVTSDKENCNNETLYSFPKSPERKRKWLEILNINNNSIKRRSRVCRRHFSSNQIAQYRLKKGALPSVKRSSSSNPIQLNLSNYVRILPKPLSENNCDVKLVHSPSFIVPNTTNSVSIPLFQAAPVPQWTSPPPQLFFSPVATGSCQTVNTTPRVSAVCKMGQVQKLRKLRRSLRHFKKKAQEVPNSMNLLAVKNPKLFKFINQQVQRCENKFPFTNDEKALALSLFYSCGRNGYNFLLQMGFKLPAIRSLTEWMSRFNFSPGINSHIKASLEQFVSGLDDFEKDCVLVWDEMGIKEYLEYVASSDELHGFVDLGHLGRDLKTANEALVFMVQGLHKNWKMPISYYFSSQATISDHLLILFRENVKLLQDVGLRVRLGVCDQAICNQAFYRKIGVTSAKPFAYFNNQKIYFVHDAPHLVKLVRNNLMKHDFVQTVRVNGRIVSRRIKWLYILTFYQKDCRYTTRIAPKLTNAHVWVKDYSKMKVRLATQTLSQSVAAGIQSMVVEGLVGPEAAVTAEFVRIIDEIFDILNISKYTGDKYNRCGKYLFSRLGKFDEYIQYLSTISIYQSNRQAEFLKGLELTLIGIKSLCLDLKKEGYNTVPTRQMQQDCLENHFSKVRMKGGFCRNPTTRQFRNSFRSLYFCHLISPKTGNTESVPDRFEQKLSNIGDRLLCLGGNRNVSNSTNSIEKATVTAQKFYGLKINRKLKLGKEQSECAISYMGVACVSVISRKFHCKTCSEMLSYDSENLPRRRMLLVDLKKCHPTQKVAYLDENSASVFFHLNKNFDKYAIDVLNCTTSGVASRLLNIFVNDTVIKTWLNDDCHEHRTAIIKYFIRSKIFRLIKDRNDCVRKIKAWNQTRRDMRNQ